MNIDANILKKYYQTKFNSTLKESYTLKESTGMQGWFNICKPINLIQHIIKMKDKNHIIIEIDAEKAFEKFNILS